MRPHALPRADLDELLAARGGAAAVRTLARTERSWRLLLLTSLRRALAEAGADDAEAWDLLVRAQRTAPGPVGDVLLHPGVGTWAAHALRLVRGSAVSPHPAGAELGRLRAVAAAAATVAGLEGTFTVPSWQGTVSLPSLGLAVLGREDDGWGEAVVEFRGGSARVREATAWLPVRRLGFGSVLLDDVDPYRGLLRAEQPRRLAESEYGAWREVAAEALQVLREVDPAGAEAMTAGLRVLVPLPAAEPHRPRSASSGDAFGAALASFPDSAEQLAATLVHEFAHNRLGALFHLYDFYAEGDGRLRYAPWRDDPRPLGGLLQGVYAFTAVARFWHARATRADAGRLAAFEAALWRRQTRRALTSLADDRALTGLGRRLVATLTAELEALPGPAVPESLPGDDHAATWRAWHLEVPPAQAEDLLRALREGRERPDPALLTEHQTVVVPASAAADFDARAVLARHRLVGAWPPPEVTGAVPGDRELAERQDDAAAEAYRSVLRRDPTSVPALVGLGLARTARHGPTDPAALALLHRPELVRALAHAGEPPEPTAAWLGRALLPA